MAVFNERWNGISKIAVYIRKGANMRVYLSRNCTSVIKKKIIVSK